MVQVGEHLLYPTVKQYTVKKKFMNNNNNNLILTSFTSFVCVSNTNNKATLCCSLFSKTQNITKNNTIAIGDI